MHIPFGSPTCLFHTPSSSQSSNFGAFSYCSWVCMHSYFRPFLFPHKMDDQGAPPGPLPIGMHCLSRPPQSESVSSSSLSSGLHHQAKLTHLWTSLSFSHTPSASHAATALSWGAGAHTAVTDDRVVQATCLWSLLAPLWTTSISCYFAAGPTQSREWVSRIQIMIAVSCSIVTDVSCSDAVPPL